MNMTKFFLIMLFFCFVAHFNGHKQRLWRQIAYIYEEPLIEPAGVATLILWSLILSSPSDSPMHHLGNHWKRHPKPYVVGLPSFFYCRDYLFSLCWPLTFPIYAAVVHHVSLLHSWRFPFSRAFDLLGASVVSPGDHAWDVFLCLQSAAHHQSTALLKMVTWETPVPWDTFRCRDSVRFAELNVVFIIFFLIYIHSVSKIQLDWLVNSPGGKQCCLPW